MRMVQRLRHLHDGGARLGNRQRAAHTRAQGAAANQLHHQKDRLFGLTATKDGYDVRVIELRDHPDLTLETPHEADAILGVVGQDLDSDHTPNREVLGTIDARGTAASDLLKKNIVANLAPDQLIPVHAQTIPAPRPRISRVCHEKLTSYLREAAHTEPASPSSG